MSSMNGISNGHAANAIECPYKLSDEEFVFTGRWLKTRQIKFKCGNGTEGVWQSAHRTTRPEGCIVDGVDIIAILKKSGKKYFIFVKQYRIPMMGFSLEFPAGLIDKNESVEEAALRELKEETGYVATSAKIIHKTEGIQGLDPGLTDDSIQFVTMEIDGDAPENATPTQNLDGTENIEVILVECSRVLEYFRQIEKDVHIEAMVYSFAIGYVFSNQIQKM